VRERREKSARSLRATAACVAPAPAFAGGAPARARARRGRPDRRATSGRHPLRNQLMELSGLGRPRLLARREGGRARAGRTSGIRASSAPDDGRDRSQLLCADPAAGPRPLRLAAPAGVSVLRQGARGRDVRGPPGPRRRIAQRAEPRLPRRPALRGHNAGSVSRAVSRSCSFRRRRHRSARGRRSSPRSSTGFSPRCRSTSSTRSSCEIRGC
jgi:hypothetical protein